MNNAPLVLALLISARTLHAAGHDVKVIHDPRPDPDIPSEARSAGTTPDPDAKTGTGSNISFRIVSDLTDHGPLRKIVTGDIHAITVRYHDGSFKDIVEVQSYGR